MIAYLKGEIIKKTAKGVILKTNNIGYFLFLTKSTQNSLKEKETTEFYTHHQVKEDTSDLYGFKKYEELEFFIQLISINGIGPKVALETLNEGLKKITRAIAQSDEKTICQIPGIGKKTAQRLILELKDKIEISDIGNIKPVETQNTKENDEAKDALLKLGYQRNHITNALKSLPKTLKTAEEIIKYFLKNA